MKMTTKTTQKMNYEKLYTCLYFGLFTLIALLLIFMQPFGDPPDEINRFRIPQYICDYGTLPNGFDPSIRIPGYGFSYAFQPILPYMIQGYLMRFVSLFTESASALLLTARLVNFFSGLLTAYFVRKIAVQLFSQRLTGWLFAMLVTFLPQSIFMHTFVNTDSFVLLSSAIMIYCWIRGMKQGYDFKLCLVLSIGIAICGLSYYNAYGLILCSIILFILSFYHRESKQFEWKKMLKLGLFTSAVVLLLIGWWFIRSAILYNGDFLGLTSREECARLYANADLNPDTRVTWSDDYSILGMLKNSSYTTVLTLSFIATFGSMTIMTNIWIYRFFKLVFAAGLFCFFCFYPKRNKGLQEKLNSIWLNSACILSILIVNGLCLYYSYTTDYQPQGRYLMPALIPFMLLLALGFEKCNLILSHLYEKTKVKLLAKLPLIYQTILIVLVVLSLLITIFLYVIPCYAQLP